MEKNKISICQLQKKFNLAENPLEITLKKSWQNLFIFGKISFRKKIAHILSTSKKFNLAEKPLEIALKKSWQNLFIFGKISFRERFVAKMSENWNRQTKTVISMQRAKKRWFPCHGRFSWQKWAKIETDKLKCGFWWDGQKKNDFDAMGDFAGENKRKFKQTT